MKRRSITRAALMAAALLILQACMTAFAVSDEDKSSITLGAALVRPYEYSGDPDGPIVVNGQKYERDATGRKVPVGTDLSGDSRPASEPL